MMVPPMVEYDNFATWPRIAAEFSHGRACPSPRIAAE